MEIIEYLSSNSLVTCCIASNFFLILVVYTSFLANRKIPRVRIEHDREQVIFVEKQKKDYKAAILLEVCAGSNF